MAFPCKIFSSPFGDEKWSRKAASTFASLYLFCFHLKLCGGEKLVHWMRKRCKERKLNWKIIKNTRLEGKESRGDWNKLLMQIDISDTVDNFFAPSSQAGKLRNFHKLYELKFKNSGKWGKIMKEISFNEICSPVPRVLWKINIIYVNIQKVCRREWKYVKEEKEVCEGTVW